MPLPTKTVIDYEPIFDAVDAALWRALSSPSTSKIDFTEEGRYSGPRYICEKVTLEIVEGLKRVLGE